MSEYETCVCVFKGQSLTTHTSLLVMFGPPEIKNRSSLDYCILSHGFPAQYSLGRNDEITENLIWWQNLSSIFLFIVLLLSINGLLLSLYHNDRCNNFQNWFSCIFICQWRWISTHLFSWYAEISVIVFLSDWHVSKDPESSSAQTNQTTRTLLHFSSLTAASVLCILFWGGQVYLLKEGWVLWLTAWLAHTVGDSLIYAMTNPSCWLTSLFIITHCRWSCVYVSGHEETNPVRLLCKQIIFPTNLIEVLAALCFGFHTVTWRLETKKVSISSSWKLLFLSRHMLHIFLFSVRYV